MEKTKRKEEKKRVTFDILQQRSGYQSFFFETKDLLSFQLCYYERKSGIPSKSKSPTDFLIHPSSQVLQCACMWI